MSNMRNSGTNPAPAAAATAPTTGTTAPPSAVSNLQHLQARYVGTGHANMTQHEWATNHHRDSIASYLGHRSIVDYFAIAEGVSSARASLNLLERMHQPCGPTPTKRPLQDLKQ